MKLTNVLKKIKFLTVLTLTCTTMLTNSCKKDSQQTLATEARLFITEARTHYEDNLSVELINDKTENISAKLDKKILWGKSKIRKSSLGDVVVTPIQLKEGLRIKIAGTEPSKIKETSYILTYRDKKGALHAEWVTMVPMNVNRDISTNRFTGLISVEDINGNFLRAFAYASDGTIKRLTLSETSVFKFASLRSTTCVSIEYGTYAYVPGHPEIPIEWNVGGYRTYCYNNNDDWHPYTGGVVTEEVPEPGDYSYTGTVPPLINFSLAIQNNLTNPCKSLAFASVTNTNIKNYITNMFSTLFLGQEGTLNLKIDEANNLTVGGNTVPAYSVLESSPTDGDTFHMTLSSNYFTGVDYNMSKEVWGEIIVHEILHSIIYKNYPGIYGSGNDHAMMFKNFVNPTKDLLVSAFGISETDALKLALTGMKDLWGYSDFNQRCITDYGVNLSEIDANFDLYTKGTGGTKCQ